MATYRCCKCGRAHEMAPEPDVVAYYYPCECIDEGDEEIRIDGADCQVIPLDHDGSIKFLIVTRHIDMEYSI